MRAPRARGRARPPAGPRAGRTSPGAARAARLGTLAFSLVVLGGCQTTAEKSAKLERRAKRVTLQQQKGLSIARRSSTVEVLGARVVHDAQRAAVVVTLRNRTARAERAVPIAVTVKDAHGRALFRNDAPGLEAALVSVPSIAAHATVVWVDDQLPAGGAPASAVAQVGEAPSFGGRPPVIAVSGARIAEDPANGVVAGGTVTNRSKVAQSSVVVFTVARRGVTIVAAGRAIVAELAPGASSPFQASLVGQALGAHPQVSAAPASLE